MQSSLLSTAICRSCQNTPPSNYILSIFHLLYDKPIIWLIPLLVGLINNAFKLQGSNNPGSTASCRYPSLQGISTTDKRDIILGVAGRSTGHPVLDFCCKATTFWTPFFLRNPPNSDLDTNGTPSSGTCLQLQISSNTMNFKTYGTHQVTEHQICLLNT